MPSRPPASPLSEQDLVAVWERFRGHTMIGQVPFVENLLICQMFGARSSGTFVECGTWKGGMAAGMMTVGGPHRDYHFFDSFEGLPPAREIDGPAAARYQQDTASPTYYDNCAADLDVFLSAVRQVPVEDGRLHVHKGWFQDTVPHYDGDRIAVLRLDGDWYDSTLVCLRYLYPQVERGGVIIIDDYDHWTGCSRAVHQYLASIDSASTINRTAAGDVVYIVKRD